MVNVLSERLILISNTETRTIYLDRLTNLIQVDHHSHMDFSFWFSFLQSGVTEVIYFVEKRLNDSDVAYVASHKLLSLANIKVTKASWIIIS